MATNFRGKIGEISIATLFGALAFRSGLEYRNADGCVNSVDDSPTSCKSLMSFRSATPEFTRLQCTQQASRNIDVRLTMFARGLYC